MSIQALKEQARYHEQREEWSRALNLYVQAIGRLEREDQPDISLYNRVGDLRTRLGDLEGAVEQYEVAVDLYAESDLPNNAIAVCKKILRNVPDRHEVHRRMGTIRAAQGFLSDARVHFLTYAERLLAHGELDQALSALAEFVKLAPDDVETRLALAEHLASHEQEEEAISHFLHARLHLLEHGRIEEAASVEERIHEIDPDVDPDAFIPEDLPVTAMPEDEGPASEFETADDEEESIPAAPTTALVGSPPSGDEEGTLPGFETTSLAEEEGSEGSVETVGEAARAEEEGEVEVAPIEDELDSSPESAVEAGALDELPGLEPTALHEEGDSEVASGEPEPLPLLEWEDEGPEPGAVGADGTDEIEELPGLDEVEFEPAEAARTAAEEVRAEVREEAEVAPSPESPPEVGDGDPQVLVERARELSEQGDEEGAVRLLVAADSRLAEEREWRRALEVLGIAIGLRPDEVGLRQRVVERVFRLDDPPALANAYLELAECLSRAGEEEKARGVFQQVLAIAPDDERAAEGLGRVGIDSGASESRAEVASSQEYVDLGALVLDETEEETRWFVATDEPSGDEQADFAKMLSQFKAKVAENLSVDDVRAHYDLGTAYREMGLVEEAIAEFQQALRAEPHHLPTYEILGQCFIEKGEPEVAIRSLQRALDVPCEVEDERLGIYYHLGRAHESLDRAREAKEYYEKVFSLDINFQDVTERLRRLR